MPGTIAASRSRGHANSGFSNRGQLGLLQRTHCSTARAELNAIARSGKLTYQGWETDMRKAYVQQLSFVAALPDLKKPLRRERLAREKPKLVAGFVSAMERKQKLGWPKLRDRSDPTLAAIDAVVGGGLNYADWKHDKRKAERFAVEAPGMVKGLLEAMQRKDRIAIGDRSDPVLAAVDALVARPLTYPEWHEDVAKAEATAVSSPRLARQEISEIERKELLFAISRGARSTNPVLSEIDAVAKRLTYHEKQRDIDMAERYAMDKPPLVANVLERMKRLQAEHEKVSIQTNKAAAWLSWSSRAA